MEVFRDGDGARHPRRLRPDRDGPADRACPTASAVRPGLDGQPAPRVRARGRRRGRPAAPTRASCASIRRPCRRSSAATSASRRSRDARVAHRRPGAPRRRRLPVVRGPPRRRDPLGRLPDRPVRGRVGAGRAPGGRRGGGRRGARRRSAARWSRPSWCCATGHAGRRRARAGAPGARQARPPPRTSTRASCEFVDELPKTASGKIKRAELRLPERRVGGRPLGLTSVRIEWRSNDNREHGHRAGAGDRPPARRRADRRSSARSSPSARRAPGEYFERARKVMPKGVPSSFQENDPWPVYIERGTRRAGVGRGRQRVHRLPQRLRRDVHRPREPAWSSRPSSGASSSGTHFAAPTEGSIGVAEELRRRFGLPQWRFTNSGHRVDDGRDPHRARRDRPRHDPQDRGLLPRPPRRGDGVGVPGARGARRPRRPASAFPTAPATRARSPS